MTERKSTLQLVLKALESLNYCIENIVNSLFADETTTLHGTPYATGPPPSA